MFSSCLHGFPAGAPVSPTVKTCILDVSPVSTLERGFGSESGVGPWVLLLTDGLNAENTFHCTLYKCPMKNLYLTGQ